MRIPKHPTQLKKCESCNQIFDRPQKSGTPFKVSWYAYAKLRFCSPECRCKWFSYTHKKENNPNWKGGNNKCLDCKKQFPVRRMKNKRCRNCWKIFSKGENHPAWRGKRVCSRCEGIKSYGSLNCRKCASETNAYKVHRPTMIKKDVSYEALHRWVVRWKGNPVKCEHCDKVGKKYNGRWIIEWANKSRKYLRDLEDWIGLCRSCHRRYDHK